MFRLEMIRLETGKEPDIILNDQLAAMMMFDKVRNIVSLAKGCSNPVAVVNLYSEVHGLMGHWQLYP